MREASVLKAAKVTAYHQNTHIYIYKHTLRTYSSISIIYIIIIVIIIFIVIYCYNHLTKNGGPQPLFRSKNASNVM